MGEKLVSWKAVTAAAGKNINEDCILLDNKGIFSDEQYLMSTNEESFEGIKVFAVADGMGGYSHGRDASRMVLEAIKARFCEDCVIASLNDINKEIIYDCLNEAKNNMEDVFIETAGTTISVLFLDVSTRKIKAYNVGDSPMFIIRKNDGAIPIYEEMTVAGKMVKNGIVSKRVAKQMNENRILTASVGKNMSFNEADIFEVQTSIESEDSLLLCSDGLSDVVEEEKIRRALQRKKSADYLLNQAIKNKTRDNVSVIVLNIGGAKVDRSSVNTISFEEKANNPELQPEDIKKSFWENKLDRYRLKKWRKELDELCENSGISKKDICLYCGKEPTSTPNFYTRKPNEKETYIGIGMAMKQTQKTIERWIKKYARKRGLYVKDCLNDLIWIYLINANVRDHSSRKNYYMEFANCRTKIEETCNELWGTKEVSSVDTIRLTESAETVPYDDEYSQLVNFVADNIGAFKTAWVKHRETLNRYLDVILSTINQQEKYSSKICLHKLRLEDIIDNNMRNYLAGGSYKNKASFVLKTRNRRSHISMCLTLGMTKVDIDEYLALLAYHPLDSTNEDEALLINFVTVGTQPSTSESFQGKEWVG